MATLATSLENIPNVAAPARVDDRPLALSRPPSSTEIVATLHAGWLRRLSVPLAFWVIAFLSAALATGAGYRDLARWAAIGPGVIGLLFGVTLWRRRAVIRQTGVEVRSLLGTRRVQYDDVEAFTYDARSYRFYLPIPIGRVAELQLRGRRGRATFHAGFSRFDQYAPFIIDRVVEATVRRMRAAIDNGERAKFGRRIDVDRRHVYVRRWLGTFRAIPIDDMVIDVADGDFMLSVPKANKPDKLKRLGVFALKSTPNLLALPQLVDELSSTSRQPVPTALREALNWRKPRQ